MTEILSDPQWTGVSSICTLIMLLLYIVVERDKLVDPTKVFVSGLLKYFLALLPALIFFSAGAIYNVTKGEYGYLSMPSVISLVLIQSLPSLPVILVITARQLHPRRKAALIGSLLGACGGALLILITALISKATWNVKLIPTLLIATGVEAVIGYYVGMTTYFVNQLFKNSPRQRKHHSTSGKGSAG